MTTEGIVRAQDGTSISYSVAGQGPWLILSNSLATDQSMWSPQFPDLSARFTVLRYDTRGHGRSDISSKDFGFDALAGDVIALMDHLEIERARFIGLSLGGMIGLTLALKHPDRLDRVICCDARADAPDGYKAMWDTNIALLHSGGMAAVADATLPRWFSEAFHADPANAATLSTVRDMILRTPPLGYQMAARCLQTLDLHKLLDQIGVPTRFIVGELDPAASVAVMQEMADRVAGASLQVVAGAAHLSNLEKPEEFLAAVTASLD